jgi:hypothetical protein
MAAVAGGQIANGGRGGHGGRVNGRGGRGGNGARGFVFTAAELHSLLDIVEEILPIGPIEWGTVVERHKVLYEAKLRDLNSIRRKFNQMATKTAPTGDSNIPEYIRRAKDIWDAIEEKTGGGFANLDELGLDLEDEIEVADELEQEPDVEGDVPGGEQQQPDLNNNQSPADEAAARETPRNNQSQLGNTRLLPRCNNPFVQPRSAVRSTVNEQMEQLARQRL